ncbi:MAG: 2OG-Fe(II) oxygenase [Acidobacteria bacterium]|nr:2OG-Fe(II) oxygenase [Acidobacteriota bacterium]
MVVEPVIPQFAPQLLESLFLDGFCVLDSVLSAEECAGIRQTITHMRAEGEFRPAQIGTGPSKQLRPDIRCDWVSWLGDPIPPALRPVFDQVEKIRMCLNQAWFLGLFRYEAHLTVYPPGSFYAKHVDQFRLVQHRKISCIFYLNENWLPEEGGALVLYNQEGQVLREILPLARRMVLMFADRIPHAVAKTTRERQSVTGWLCSRD